jgi:hypothetical protein
MATTDIENPPQVVLRSTATNLGSAHTVVTHGLKGGRPVLWLSGYVIDNRFQKPETPRLAFLMRTTRFSLTKLGMRAMLAITFSV